MWDIGTQRQIDTQFKFMPWRLIILRYPLPYLARSYTNDRIRACVIVARPSEDLGAKITLLQNLGIVLYCAFDNEPEK